MTDSRISVVMISRDRAAEAVQALERLRRLPERPRIVFVDNASSDGSAAVVRRRFPACA